MDTSSITDLANSILPVLQPYIPIIAAKAAEKIGEGLPSAIGKLWTAIQSKLSSRPASEEALQDWLADSQNQDVQAALRVQLKKALEADDDFSAEIKAFLSESGAQPSIAVRDGAAAIGDQVKAVGKGGMLVEGDVGGDVIGPGGKKNG